MLSELIIRKIRDEGPISFRDFMELALYHPEYGYYTSTKEKIGKEGDYYTSPTLHPVFGTLVARQLEQMWILNQSCDFQVLEYGAGTGMLCRDILEYLNKNPEMQSHFNYIIVEKSPWMREKGKEHLKNFKNVCWIENIHQVPKKITCIISNELIDNLSVHQVVMLDELQEIFIDYQNGFIEVMKPAAEPVKTYLKELNIVLPYGFRAEVNLEAVQWVKDLSEAVQKGYIITIDYGYLSSELLNKRKNNGTLLCYNKHTINDEPYREPGHQDITAHVNFSALQHWGAKCGWECCGLTDQAHFLLSLGFKEYFRQPQSTDQNMLRLVLEEVHLTRTLLLDMGRKIKVLIQRKGVSSQNLLGLQHEYSRMI